MFKKKITEKVPVKIVEAKPVAPKAKPVVPKPVPVVIAPVEMVKIMYLGGSPLPFKAYETTFNPIGEVPMDIAVKLLQNYRKWRAV